MSVQYQVFVTPLVSSGVYGNEYDISDWVDQTQGGQITVSIDSTDFSIGVYTYSDVSLICDASDGHLGDQNDSRSIFPYGRDLAKVRVCYNNGSQTFTFYGIISEAGTVIDVTNEQITLLVLSRNSVINTSKVPPGTVTDGMTFQQALLAILGGVDIGSLLNVQSSNINVGYNGTVDIGAKFDNMAKTDAVNQLLFASNSCLVIDSSQNLIISNRSVTGNPTLYLYGKGDLQGRENIVDGGVENYNTGLQRVFNSIVIKGGQVASTTVSGTTSTTTSTVPVAVSGSSGTATTQTQVSVYDDVSVGLYGWRQKEFTLEWLNNSTTMLAVANAVLAEFKNLKAELEVTVPTDVAYTTNLLDPVSVDYPLRVAPAGKFMFTVGVSKVGDSLSPIPYAFGAITIDPSVAFKVIEKTEDLTSFTTKLKLRQV